MALTLAQFRIEFPAYADVAAWPDAIVDLRLQRAGAKMNADVFGSEFDEAQGYLTAHMLELHRQGSAAATGGDAAGRLPQSVTAGSVSVTYASEGSSSGGGGATSASPNGATSWGRMYDAIARRRTLGIHVLGGPGYGRR